jgi:hypothetical protein
MWCGVHLMERAVHRLESIDCSKHGSPLPTHPRLSSCAPSWAKLAGTLATHYCSMALTLLERTSHTLSLPTRRTSPSDAVFRSHHARIQTSQDEKIDQTHSQTYMHASQNPRMETHTLYTQPRPALVQSILPALCVTCAMQRSPARG